MLTVLIVTLFFVGGIALIVSYLKSFYAERDNRAKKAEEHRSKHGGESILEWNGNFGVLWIYPKKGATIGLREMSYQFDNEIMEKIKQGLGF